LTLIRNEAVHNPKCVCLHWIHVGLTRDLCRVQVRYRTTLSNESSFACLYCVLLFSYRLCFNYTAKSSFPHSTLNVISSHELSHAVWRFLTLWTKSNETTFLAPVVCKIVIQPGRLTTLD